MADPVEGLEENSSEITNITNEANSTSVSLIDIQRLKAEYENYKKRVERDRSVTHDLAVSSVLTALLPIMDDIDRAQSHGELTGGFKAVGEQIKIATERIGLEKFGEEGDTFDPSIHEALIHDKSVEVSDLIATKILQPGYRYKNRILRAALVGVTEPEISALREVISTEGMDIE